MNQSFIAKRLACFSALRAVENSISENPLVQKPDFGVTIHYVDVLGSVMAACKLAAGGNILQVEEPAELEALAAKLEEDVDSLLGGGPNEIFHDPLNV